MLDILALFLVDGRKSFVERSETFSLDYSRREVNPGLWAVDVGVCCSEKGAIV